MTLARSRLLAALVLAAPPALAVAATPRIQSGVPPAPALRCFGAASRDPRHSCFNPALRRLVYPNPIAALLLPEGPCGPEHWNGLLRMCSFGTLRERAALEIALVGDSHAGQWRVALREVAREQGWHGTSITRVGCPLTRAPLAFPPPAARSCRRWNREATAWFVRHPEVHVAVVSAHAHVPVVASPGRTPLAVRAAGYLAAWRALPSTVRRIVVLRDGPVRKLRTLDCVEHQLAVRGPAGTACAVPRRVALPTDAEAVAARRARDARVRLVDLSRFYCGRHVCPPVVGGALVSKDGDHMSAVFVRTMAPYLARLLARRLGVYGSNVNAST